MIWAEVKDIERSEKRNIYIIKKIMRDFPTHKDWNDYVHYTCQSVSPQKLKNKKIRMIGEEYGIEAREVLRVPAKTLYNAWYRPKSDTDAQALIEAMLRRM